jgi:hypothetical protein
MIQRPELELRRETLGRARDLADRADIPQDTRNEVAQTALELGLDDLVALHVADVRGHVCTVAGCTNTVEVVLQCGPCRESGPGGGR